MDAAGRDYLSDGWRRGMIGMWKAFEEMEQLGWIGASGLVKAEDDYRAGRRLRADREGVGGREERSSKMWPGAQTFAAGLRVPKAYGDYLILDILKKSGGTAVAATDEEILAATRHWASVEGVFAAPEGAASLVAYRKLRASGFLRPEDTVVLFNTGSAYKYLDMMEAQEGGRSERCRPRRNIGGIIGPY